MTEIILLIILSIMTRSVLTGCYSKS